MTSSCQKFTRLLQTTKRACDTLSPLVQSLYETASELNEFKQDKSVFTIADGLVQEFLTTHLFKNGEKFKSIVGEEDESVINLVEKPYTISHLEVPVNLYDAIDQVRKDIINLSEEIVDDFQECTIFIDPIDGTREFSTKQGEQCTILVGFAEKGFPVAGVVYRPITTPTTWAIGCKEEQLDEGNLDIQYVFKTTSSKPDPNGLLTTNGSISPFMEKLLENMLKTTSSQDKDDLRIKAGGVGNKLMNIFEGKGECYISDRGVSRWDTCAAQAVIEAKGGVLAKLTSFIESKTLESYKYEKTDINLDFSIQSPPNLTKYNQNDKTTTTPTPLEESKTENNIVKSKTENNIATCPTQLKPYANVCGLLALDAKALSRIDQYHTMIMNAKQDQQPSFD